MVLDSSDEISFRSSVGPGMKRAGEAAKIPAKPYIESMILLLLQLTDEPWRLRDEQDRL